MTRGVSLPRDSKTRSGPNLAFQSTAADLSSSSVQTPALLVPKEPGLAKPTNRGSLKTAHPKRQAERQNLAVMLLFAKFTVLSKMYEIDCEISLVAGDDGMRALLQLTSCNPINYPHHPLTHSTMISPK